MRKLFLPFIGLLGMFVLFGVGCTKNAGSAGGGSEQMKTYMQGCKLACSLLLLVAVSGCASDAPVRGKSEVSSENTQHTEASTTEASGSFEMAAVSEYVVGCTVADQRDNSSLQVPRGHHHPSKLIVVLPEDKAEVTGTAHLSIAAAIGKKRMEKGGGSRATSTKVRFNSTNE